MPRVQKQKINPITIEDDDSDFELDIKPKNKVDIKVNQKNKCVDYDFDEEEPESEQINELLKNDLLEGNETEFDKINDDNIDENNIESVDDKDEIIENEPLPHATVLPLDEQVDEAIKGYETLPTDPNFKNTYNTFKNNKQAHGDIIYDDIYIDNNLIFLNVLSKPESSEKYNAFHLNNLKNPNFISNDKDFKKLAKKVFNKKFDSAEVLRGDYSKLFFDIDGHNERDVMEGFDVVIKIFEIIKNDVKNVKLSGVIDYNPTVKQEWIDTLLNKFSAYKNVFITVNKFQVSKSFSAHLYISGCCFSRVELYECFEAYNSKPKRERSSFPKCVDSCVYVQGQRMFRTVLSGKIERPVNPLYTDKFCEYIYQHINEFCCTKTETDTVLITGQTLEKLKTYLNTFSLKCSPKEDRDKVKKWQNTKQDLGLEFDIREPILLNDSWNEWLWNLDYKIALQKAANPDITGDELLKMFDVESEYYETQTHHNRIRNVAAIKSAIKFVEDNGVYHWMNNFKKTFNTRITRDFFKFSIEQFVNFCKKYNTIQALAMVYNATFCWFNSTTDDKKAGEFIAYVNNENEIVIDPVERLYKEFRNKQFQTIVIRQTTIETKDENGAAVKKLVDVPLSLNFEDICKYCYKYRFEVKNFDIYTLEPNVLNLYNGQTTHEPVELDDMWKTIFEIYATEQDESLNYVVNNEKYEYILNWFAYMLQHPESRNKTLLYIAGKQGIGKNLVTNAIVKILGKKFCCGDADIDDVCGTFNSLIKNKKMIVINELKTSGYSDEIKKLIDEYIRINEKSKPQYVENNKCNYIIFSNHLNTNIIQKDDRRFAFIYSTAQPEDKAFYASFFNGDEYKPELLDNLFYHLLSRDLTNYRNNEAPVFDKVKIYESMDMKRSPAYLATVEIMKANQNKPMLLIDVVEQLNQMKENAIASPNGGYEDDLAGININMRTIYNLLSFNDTDDYQIKQNKHDHKRVLYYRNYKPTGPKEKMIEIMKERENKRLEVNEAVKMLADKGFTGITTRTLRKVLDFNDDDEYEIKKQNGKTYIVYKSE